jgi:ABC-2 type transport system permease protein
MFSAVFRDLVRHEFRSKGNWKKQNRTRIPRGWWWAYFLCILVAMIGTATYFALRNDLQVNAIWTITLGFPYIVFFLGFGSIKNEWGNETYGWWLTLPESRMRLIAAKWLGSWLKVWAAILMLFVIASIYVMILSFTIPYYSFETAREFMATGIQWLSLIVTLSPLIIAAGILMGILQHTVIRPLAPILWVVFMAALGLTYSLTDIVIPESSFSPQQSLWVSYPLELPAIVAVDWILAFAVLRITAFLLEKKLDL